MKWNQLKSLETINEIKEISKQKKVMIFKHSTRCSISSTALNRLERAWKEQEMEMIEPYYLDLIAFREISQAIAENFGVQHESPQVIVIENQKAIFDTSHLDINYMELKEIVNN